MEMTYRFYMASSGPHLQRPDRRLDLLQALVLDGTSTMKCTVK
jgi:hypothetical protein